MARGYIYILRTADRPTVVKIGKTTTSPTQRLRELNTACYLSINNWELADWFWVRNCDLAEKKIHRSLGKFKLKIHQHKEAFKIDVEHAKIVAKQVCDQFPPDSDELERKKRRPESKPLYAKSRDSLDKVAGDHVRRQGPFSEAITERFSNWKKADYFAWLSEVEHML